jgi:hypothetical protein
MNDNSSETPSQNKHFEIKDLQAQTQQVPSFFFILFFFFLKKKREDKNEFLPVCFAYTLIWKVWRSLFLFTPFCFLLLLLLLLLLLVVAVVVIQHLVPIVRGISTSMTASIT